MTESRSLRIKAQWSNLSHGSFEGGGGGGKGGPSDFVF